MISESFRQRIIIAVSFAAVGVLVTQVVATVFPCCGNTYSWKPGGDQPCSGPSMSVCDKSSPDTPTGQPGKRQQSIRSRVCTNYAQDDNTNWYLGSCNDGPPGFIKLPGTDGATPASCCWVKNATVVVTTQTGTVGDCTGTACTGGS